MSDYTPTMIDLRVRLEEYQLAYSFIPREQTGAEFTRALQAHDRQVAAKALTDAAELADTFSEGSGIARALRVIASLVPGNPEPTEGEKRG
jgi:hypothetical protein